MREVELRLSKDNKILTRYSFKYILYHKMLVKKNIFLLKKLNNIVDGNRYVDDKDCNYTIQFKSISSAYIDFHIGRENE